jgi:hypothetical protein
MPWRAGATIDEAIALIEREMTTECVGRNDEGILVKEASFCSPSGLLLDVAFAAGRIGPRFAPTLNGNGS